MRTRTLPEARAIAAAYDFSGMQILADVGGGYGGLLTTILVENPAMQGILYDMPQVVAGAAPNLARAGVAERCQTIGGDFFISVPAGADGYLLKNILHDWNDERCITLLRHCRQGIQENGRLLVVEVLISPEERMNYAKFLDFKMLVLVNTGERSEAEYAQLLAAAGFRLTRVIPTQVDMYILEAVPVA
jgi:hypothetical protein